MTEAERDDGRRDGAEVVGVFPFAVVGGVVVVVVVVGGRGGSRMFLVFVGCGGVRWEGCLCFFRVFFVFWGWWVVGCGEYCMSSVFHDCG